MNSSLLREHLNQCEPCRQVVDFDQSLDQSELAHVLTLEPSQELKALVASTQGPTVRSSCWRRAVLPTSITALAAAAVLPILRVDFHSQPGWFAYGVAAMWAGMFALGLVTVLAPGRWGLGIPPWLRMAYVAGSIAVFETVAWTATRPTSYSLIRVGVDAWWSHLACALAGTAVAALIGVLMVRAARRTAAVSPTTAGSAAGTAAGFAAALCGHLECAFANASHIALAHLVPVALGAIVGALVGRRWLEP
jgi:hypothetical protein